MDEGFEFACFLQEVEDDNSKGEEDDGDHGRAPFVEVGKVPCHHGGERAE